MKAIEYVDRYKTYLTNPPNIWKDAPEDYNPGTDPELEAVLGICRDLVIEAIEIVSARKAKTNRAVASVFLEQDKKFQAILRLLNNPALKSGGFRGVVRVQIPVVFSALMTRYGW